MSKTILKTFRLPREVAEEIEREADKRNISQAGYVIAIVTENKFFKLQKAFETDAHALGNDEQYKKEQQDLADANFM